MGNRFFVEKNINLLQRLLKKQEAEYLIYNLIKTSQSDLPCHSVTAGSPNSLLLKVHKSEFTFH